MITSLSFIIVSLILVFPNSLYFTFTILSIVIIFLYMLVTSGHLLTLTIIMLCIVYVGAIIILIGYICAICPNLNLTSSLDIFPFLLLSLFFSYISSLHNYSPFSHHGSILDYMYSGDGIPLFILIVVILFVTLLMVTSQYLVPKGPFRSTI